LTIREAVIGESIAEVWVTLWDRHVHEVNSKRLHDLYKDTPLLAILDWS
jgi:hypothetical protein